MIEAFHKLLLRNGLASEGAWGFFVSGLILIAAMFGLWLFGVALRQRRLAQRLPKGSYNEEIEFGWATMGLVILLGPWVRINVLSPIVTSLLLTHVFFGGTLGPLEQIRTIKILRRNYRALRTALTANYHECRSIQKGFRLGNISRYIDAQINFAKFGERVILGVFAQSCKITVALAAAMSLLKGLVDVPEKGFVNLPVSVFAHIGIGVGLNFLFVLPCTYICLELIGARMLLEPEPSESAIKSAQTEVERFCKEELGLWSWGSFFGWLILLAVLMASGIMTHLLWTLRDLVGR